MTASGTITGACLQAWNGSCRFVFGAVIVFMLSAQGAPVISGDPAGNGGEASEVQMPPAEASGSGASEPAPQAAQPQPSPPAKKAEDDSGAARRRMLMLLLMRSAASLRPFGGMGQ